MLWQDDRITTILFGVKKPWVENEEDTPFVIILKQRKADRPHIWLHGSVQKVDGKRHLQLSVTAETKSDTSSFYVTDRMKAHNLTVGNFFRLLVQYGFDQYQFADSGDGRHWIFKLKKFLLDRNNLLYFDSDNTPLETCSSWWNEVEDGLFKGNPEVEPYWCSKHGKERFEAVKRCLAEAGLYS